MNRKHLIHIAIASTAIASTIAVPWVALAQVPPMPLIDDTNSKPSEAPFNLPTKTLGGIQFWTDQRVHGDWRIQCNSVTGHCRLLNPRNVRRAWGSYEQCEAILEENLKKSQVDPIPEHVVVLLHGLMGSRPLLQPLQQHLRKNGLEAMCVSYASTRHSIDDHAKALEKVIERFGPDVRRIDFVAHSMGNIVLRRYLGMMTVGSPMRRRLGRVVMLAPPNQGAEVASFLRKNAMFQLITGDSGKELANFRDLEAKLAIPQTPFGIVAGGGGTRNPIVAGDDDLLVGIEETKLAGAADFIVVDALHRSLPKDPKVIEVTTRFLTKGYFQSEDRRLRLPAKPRRAAPAGGN